MTGVKTLEQHENFYRESRQLVEGLQQPRLIAYFTTLLLLLIHSRWRFPEISGYLNIGISNRCKDG